MTDFIAALEEQLLAAHRERRRSRRPIPWRGGAMVVAAAATVAAVVAVVIALASPSAHRAAPLQQQHQQAPPQTRPVHSVARTRVSVLNGTSIVGLARAAADKLSASDFREGLVTNDTTNQQRPTTQVFYEAKARVAALDVAKILGVPTSQIKPMDANARALADRAQVAVFVGGDKAQ